MHNLTNATSDLTENLEIGLMCLSTEIHKNNMLGSQNGLSKIFYYYLNFLFQLHFILFIFFGPNTKKNPLNHHKKKKKKKKRGGKEQNHW